MPLEQNPDPTAQPGEPPPDHAADPISHPPPPKRANAMSLLIPHEGYFVTPIIMYLNVLVFVAMVCTGVNAFLPENQDLLKWGANLRPLVLEGQWWRLITNVFLHIGFLHLLLNMYALLFVGLLLEPHLGRLRFAIAYFLTGIIASLASLCWHPFTISAGASGAIFGMYGVFTALLTTSLIEETQRKSLMTSMAIFIGYNLYSGFRGEGVDNAAHIGGLLGGFVIGYLFIPGLREPQNTRRLYWPIVVATLLTLVATILVIKNTNDDIAIYDKKMTTFGELEQTALAIQKLTADSSKQRWLTTLKDSGLYNWNKCLVLVRDMKKLDLPKSLSDRTVLLEQYCNLRIASYSYFYREIAADRDGSDSANWYRDHVGAIADSLKAQ